MDYQGIIDNINEDRAQIILTKLGIDFENKGSYLLMNTYCHHHMSEDCSRKLYYYFNNKIFMCYSQDGPMSWFKFLNHFYEAQGTTYDFYHDIYQLLVDTTDSVDGFIMPEPLSITHYKPLETPDLPIYDSKVLGCFKDYYPAEWLNDGISEDAMRKFNIKYDSVRNRIIIPHYNSLNELVGIRARALNPDDVEQFGKYMPICMEKTWYSHPLSMNVYGLNVNKYNINIHNKVFVAESEKSVLQFESFNMPNCVVAACGSNFNKYALLTILRNCKVDEVILCFDNEELPGSDKYYNKLRGICEKYSMYCNFSFIYDRFGLTKLKDSPFDNGEEVFTKLYRDRVKY